MDAQNLWDIAGVSFNYVPYDDASKSRAAVLGGHAVVYQSYASGAKSSVDAGELKVLAVGADERLDFWPDVPTLKECVADPTTQEQLIAMGQSPSWMTNEEMHEYGDIYAKLNG